MKYIKKSEIPHFFIDDTKYLNNWNEYFADKKRSLKKHILLNEQNSLCGYCESKVVLENSHLEHIKPKSLDSDNLTFDYSNLLVSCNGTCYTNGNIPETCGHKKAEYFKEDLFLNPTKIKNIREYFSYSNDGEITSSKFDENKSKYTIDLLKLNTFNNNIQEARKKALIEFRNSILKHSKSTDKELPVIAKGLLDKEDLAFISFLRFQYRHIL